MHVHDRVLNKFVYHMCQAKGRNFTLILKAEELRGKGGEGRVCWRLHPRSHNTNKYIAF